MQASVQGLGDASVYGRQTALVQGNDSTHTTQWTPTAIPALTHPTLVALQRKMDADYKKQKKLYGGFLHVRESPLPLLAVVVTCVLSPFYWLSIARVLFCLFFSFAFLYRPSFNIPKIAIACSLESQKCSKTQTTYSYSTQTNHEFGLCFREERATGRDRRELRRSRTEHHHAPRAL